MLSKNDHACNFSDQVENHLLPITVRKYYYIRYENVFCDFIEASILFPWLYLPVCLCKPICLCLHLIKCVTTPW